MLNDDMTMMIATAFVFAKKNVKSNHMLRNQE